MSLFGELEAMEAADLLDDLLDDLFPGVCADSDQEVGGWGPLDAEVLSDTAVDSFLCELLCSPLDEGPSSPLASDSGISEGQAAVPSPGVWEPSPPGSPNIVQTEHNYSMLQEIDLDALQSVRSETCDGDVFIDLGRFSKFSPSPDLTCPLLISFPQTFSPSPDLTCPLLISFPQKFSPSPDI
ncbi:unnamed protein product [Ranitomeya imitator]|uniref:Uncharacterized protein n=1 Tax=Ranitomeya imitator TaxID=111125 RepID=A0ABN9M5E8_9NEOB|nr:unnamed protein product [Ranitomeya imitator]